MSTRERVLAAIAGEEVDRPPVSIWRHFPERDQTADDLAKVHLIWQEAYAFDFVKFMPPGDYPTIDWGAESRFEGAPGGTRTTTRFPIQRPADWAKLTPLNVERGFNGVILSGIRRTKADLGQVIPLFHTVFSPLTIAMKLSNRLAIEHLRAHPNEMHAGLEVITDVTKAMVAASIAAGADGIFFATQCADYTVMDELEYREFGLPYDLRVLEAAADRIRLLHVHGTAPMFDLAAHYPAQAINWHDRAGAPHLADGQRLANRCVMGGLNQETFATATPEQIAADARDAIAQTGGRRLIVAPGCAIPYDTPAENTLAALEAVRGAGQAD